MPLFPPQEYRKTEYTHRRGTAAARPAAADVLPGTLYFSTDTGVIERSTGSAWESYSVTTIASMTDYAEGTWTPTLTFGGGSTGITYSFQNGRYIKIGKFVALSGLIVLTSKGSSTGNAVLTGLPFTIGNGFEFITAMKVGYTSFTAGVQEVGLQGIINTTTVNTVKSVAGINTVMTDVDYTNSSQLVIYFCFIIG